jgi:aryl-alcohol dehydrogenase-like predicted oxidoreductase
MGFSHGYGPGPDHDTAVSLIRHAYDEGCTFFDTAEGYGAGANEELVGEALEPMRGQVIIATKLHITPAEASTQAALAYQLRRRLEASLTRLRTDHVDLYYQHRVNKEIPIEDVAGCMGELIYEGKIGGWGQSQATEAELQQAHAVTPLTAVQSEYSIMERMFERDVIPACEDLGIGFVAFSPLASGFLAGTATSDANYTGDDVRRVITRFAPDNMRANRPLLDVIRGFADNKGATPAQVSLAWMLRKSPSIVPIPGSRKATRIDENLGAAEVELSDEEFSRIETELARIEIHGNRTDEDIAKLRATS